MALHQGRVQGHDDRDAADPMERFLEAMAAGLNGPDAEGKDLKVNLVLTDLKESFMCCGSRTQYCESSSAPNRPLTPTPHWR